jgi:small-conductance mechanosensitive channel
MDFQILFQTAQPTRTTLTFWEELPFRLLIILITCLLLYLIGRLGKFIIKRAVKRKTRRRTLGALLNNTIDITLIILGFLVFITILFDVGIPALLASLGFLGAAIGISFQDIFKNIWAGMYILIEQLYQIGDRVKVKDVEGTVELIQIRTTVLRTDSGLEIIVPNSIMFSEIVINQTSEDKYLASFQLKVPTEFGLTKTTQAVEDVFKSYQNESLKAELAPVVQLESTTDGKLAVRVNFWVPHSLSGQPRLELANAVRKALPEAEIIVG